MNLSSDSISRTRSTKPENYELEHVRDSPQKSVADGKLSRFGCRYWASTAPFEHLDTSVLAYYFLVRLL